MTRVSVHEYAAALRLRYQAATKWEKDRLLSNPDSILACSLRDMQGTVLRLLNNNP